MKRAVTGLSPIGLLLVVATSGCTSLDRVENDVCGNNVLEKDEDCDFFAEGEESCGAPDTNNACFFVCDTKAELLCPSGYGCGADGRCRKASGQYLAQSAVEFPVERFDTGDVDGDGSPDVVATTQNRLFIGFGSDEGSIDTVAEAASNTPRPFLSLGDLNADGRSDIVSATSGGLNVVLGSADRSLHAEVFPTFSFENDSLVRIAVAPIVNTAGLLAPNEIMSIIFTTSGTFFGAGESTNVDLGALLGRPVQPGLFHPPLAAGNLNGFLNPEAELAFTLDGESRVWIMDLSGVYGQPAATVTTILQMPGESTARGRPFIVDFDNDNDLDVVVAVVGAATFAVFPNNGNGTFAAPFTRNLPLTSPDAEILGFADLANGGELEILTSEGARSSSFLPLFVVGASWRSATSADMNGDGQLDIVAIPQVAPGVEVFLGNPGSNAYTRFAVGNSLFANGTGNILIADFDGDFVTDAVVTSPAVSGEIDFRVLYGRLDGGFEEPEVKARYDSLIDAALVDGAPGLPAIVVTEQNDDLGVLEISFLASDSSRSLLAPLLLVDLSADLVGGFQEPEFHLPLNAVIANPPDSDVPGVFVTAFGGGNPFADDPPDLCADPNSNTDCTFAWGIEGDGAGGLLRDANPPNKLNLTFNQLACLDIAAEDVLGLGHDQLIAWAADPGCGADFGLNRLQLVDLGDGTSSIDGFEPPGNLGRIVDVLSGDFDGDGVGELVVLYLGSAANPETGGLAIYRPGVSAGVAQAIELPQFKPVALSAADLDGDGIAELTISGSVGRLGDNEAAVWLATWDEASASYSAPVPNTALSIGTFGRTADMNSDGLADMVVGNGLSVTVMLAVPSEPRGTIAEREAADDSDGSDEGEGN